MEKLIIEQLRKKFIEVHLDDDNRFYGTHSVQLETFFLEFHLEAYGTRDDPDRSVGYFGGSVITSTMYVTDIMVWHEGDEVDVDESILANEIIENVELS